ncbi:protein ABHD18 [Culicoides brevitarsis]|uniref:protein ABHD18 n=1 Tax=Culicoides brevitarsis TaxID=469753 RepID=UPI00307C59F3
MPPSKLDAIYRSLLLTKFFTKGWGKPENLQRIFEFRKLISNRETCYNLVPKDYPIEITKEEVTSDCRIIDGKFTTPLELYLPGLVPKCAQDAHFQMVLPLQWKDPVHKPMCIHLAGTGDHYFWRRRNLIAKPLLKEANLGAIILENPFYGMRKPKDQHASSLHNVSDIFVMGGCLVLESLVLLNWCERNGYGPLGITGLSMGGHMASLAATNWPKPLVLVPCLSWSTASAVFTQGVMSQSINWDVLETQYFSDGNYREKLSKMVTIVDDAFLAGQQFVKTYSESMQELQKDIKEMDDLTTNTNEPVNLGVVNNTKPKDGVKSRLIDIKAHKNLLNLSENLLNKLLSTEKCELTTEEINELNTKIKLALEKIKAENGNDEKKTVLSSTDENSKEKMVLQSDTANNESSTYLSSAINVGRTKLMSLISPSSSSSTSNEITANTVETLPATKRASFDITKTNWWEREATQFMRGMMDECTHLKNFSVPYDTSLIIAVCAKDDAYIPREGCSSLEHIWPGCEIRYLDAGHVSAYVLHQKLFRSSIAEAFERAKKIYDAENAHNLELQQRRLIFPDTTSLRDRIKELQVLKR